MEDPPRKKYKQQDLGPLLLNATKANLDDTVADFFYGTGKCAGQSYISLAVSEHSHQASESQTGLINVSAAIRMAAVSKCTDTPVASQRLARHACPTRYVSDTASRVVQLCRGPRPSWQLQWLI